MDREVYYENSNVLDIKDYSYMMKTIQASPINRCSGKDQIRKIYFNNDINILANRIKIKTLPIPSNECDK